MSEPIELLPCPFCGSEARFWEGDFGVSELAAACTNDDCGVWTTKEIPDSVYGNEYLEIEQDLLARKFIAQHWNTRPTDPLIGKLVEALEIGLVAQKEVLHRSVIDCEKKAPNLHRRSIVSIDKALAAARKQMGEG